MVEQSYLLTDKERDRFAWWLENEAKTSLGMAEQAEKLGIQGLVTKERAHALAATVISKKLRSTQSVTIR
jgi:hypothetical protein